MCRQELAGREQIVDHTPSWKVKSLSTSSENETASPSDKPAGENQPSSSGEAVQTAKTDLAKSPILISSACSGYFVEPLKWMDHFLKDGELAGKIICPNQRCKAKLGNYDWAGVGCGCKEWVTPGFCINRSKVDEITIL